MTVAVALSAVFAVSCEKSEDKQVPQTTAEQIFPAPDGTTSGMEPMKATVELDNGNKLFFVTDKENEAVMVVEEHDCIDCSAIEFLGEKMGDDMSAYDVFWAFSKPGTEVPAVLKAEAGTGQKSGNQGWARTDLGKGQAESDLKGYACNNSSFASGSWLGGTANYIRYDKRPNEWGGFFGDCWNPFANGGCVDGPRYQSSAGYNGVTHFKGRLCARNIENSSQDHYYAGLYRGPGLTFTKRASNGNFYTMTIDGTTAYWEIGANQLKSYTWYVINTNGGDYRAQVRYAKRYDEFDILVDK